MMTPEQREAPTLPPPAERPTPTPIESWWAARVRAGHFVQLCGPFDRAEAAREVACAMLHTAGDSRGYLPNTFAGSLNPAHLQEVE